LDFGTVSGSPTVQTDTAANITIDCSGAPNSVLRVCVGITAGTGLGSVLGNRRMSSNTNTIQYQIYTNAARTTVWGIRGAAQSDQQFSVSLNGSGVGSISPTMFGRIFSGQTMPAGIYTSTLTIVGRIPNGSSPCSSGSAGTGFASTFNATATNSPACTVNASEINFGVVDRLASAINATGTLQVVCTPGAPYTIAMNGGSTTGNIADRKMSVNGSGPGVIAYQLYLDNHRTVLWGDGVTGTVQPGTGTGGQQTPTVFAQVPVQANASVGNFQDTVTVTLSF
jgi:spore coat protein U-like protein